MNKIEVKILNPDAIADAERMMVAMARLTQRGHAIHDMSDFEAMMDREYSENLVDTLIDLPHPTIQKFGVINIVIVGASRRFLAQITRHQNEVKFMSGSLQYSDYSEDAQFVVPYEIIRANANANSAVCCCSDNYILNQYLEACKESMEAYACISSNVGNDAAGYAAPQGLRNVLVISATPYQWKHMISQRTCNRNTSETQYVMLLIWEQLYKWSRMFRNCGPFCMNGSCPEGKMCCGNPFEGPLTPSVVLDRSFPLIRGK